jgi:hypothetical protein
MWKAFFHRDSLFVLQFITLRYFQTKPMRQSSSSFWLQERNNYDSRFEIMNNLKSQRKIKPNKMVLPETRAEDAATRIR